jgi:hypothetical protein
LVSLKKGQYCGKLDNKAPHQVSGKPERKGLLCSFGFHKWKKMWFEYLSSDVRGIYFVCVRCEKKKTVYEAKKKKSFDGKYCK